MVVCVRRFVVWCKLVVGWLGSLAYSRFVSSIIEPCKTVQQPLAAADDAVAAVGNGLIVRCIVRLLVPDCLRCLALCCFPAWLPVCRLCVRLAGSQQESWPASQPARQYGVVLTFCKLVLVCIHSICVNRILSQHVLCVCEKDNDDDEVVFCFNYRGCTMDGRQMDNDDNISGTAATTVC